MTSLTEVTRFSVTLGSNIFGNHYTIADEAGHRIGRIVTTSKFFARILTGSTLAIRDSKRTVAELTSRKVGLAGFELSRDNTPIAELYRIGIIPRGVTLELANGKSHDLLREGLTSNYSLTFDDGIRVRLTSKHVPLRKAITGAHAFDVTISKQLDEDRLLAVLAAAAIVLLFKIEADASAVTIVG